MNLDIYAEEMSKSVWDKAFFMDKIIGAKLVIDFGCADGAMIRMLAPLFPNTTFYGYDILLRIKIPSSFIKKEVIQIIMTALKI